jgi:hypothetical protein
VIPLSAKGFAEFVLGGPSKKAQIVRNILKPKSKEAQVVVLYYSLPFESFASITPRAMTSCGSPIHNGDIHGGHDHIVNVGRWAQASNNLSANRFPLDTILPTPPLA